jgi:hypothetical protein
VSEKAWAYFERIGRLNAGGLIERAEKGQLLDYLEACQVASLFLGRYPAAPEAYDYDEHRAHEAQWELIGRDIEEACRAGALKARAVLAQTEHVPCENGGHVEIPSYQYFIHRDDARRHFQRLGLEPEPGSPLWCWLQGRAATDAKRLLPVQQAKADFQKLCKERWKVTDTLPITGPGGVAAVLIREGYRSHYTRGTLEDWSREVAPEGVKGRRGRRPGKISAEPGK